MNYKKHPEQLVRNFISAPFILSMIIPLIILDIFIEIYHNIAFRLYKIPLIKRTAYIKMDRIRLKYLNTLDKISCAYCGYANGLLVYSVEIAGKTEEYWCGIKHKNDTGFIEPPHHENFIEYGDKEAYEKLGNIKMVD